MTDKVAESRSHHRDPEKMKLHALQRMGYDPREMVFVDEAHKRGRDLRWRRAKGRHGKKAFSPVSQHLGRNWTYVAAMNHTGFVAYEVVELCNVLLDIPVLVPTRKYWVP